MKYITKFLICLIAVFGVFVVVGEVSAQTYNYTSVGFESLKLDDATAQKGYTIQAFDNQFRFGITPGVLTEGGTFEFKEIELSKNSGMEIPEGYVLASKIIEFDIKNKEAYDPSKPFWLQMSFDSDLKFDKFLFYFDQGKGMWVELPSITDLDNNIVKAAFHLPFAKLAVFDTETMQFGKASWYRYKGCMCAASPDYPKGTELFVTNLNKNESILVTVNDWGPERDVFPNRVIDLDLVAFSQLASKGTGVLQNIYVIPYIADDFSKIENTLLEGGGVLPLSDDRMKLIKGGITSESSANNPTQTQ